MATAEVAHLLGHISVDGEAVVAAAGQAAAAADSVDSAGAEVAVDLVAEAPDQVGDFSLGNIAS